MADGSLLFDTKINSSGFDEGVKTLSSKAKSALSSVGSSLAGGMGKVATGALKTAAAGVIAGITAEATGLVALTKSAVSNFGDYEQLVGGVETLFKGNASEVIAYASNAYKTAGMSANDYMETATGFSASLLQSLGGDTKKAAKISDRAITDMSDNANKMGTDMGRIQDAYQGFAKQNYTMLDNLKLGYGGTKEEMARLIDDANKLKKANGQAANLSIKSFADIIEAIGLVQDEMGITGTTAKEAASTIQGSFGMVGASWKNLLTGMGDKDQDTDKLFDQLEDSVYTALDNLMPVIETAAPRIMEGMEKSIKIGIEGLANNPDLSKTISTSLSMLLDGGIEILDIGNANFGKISDGIFNGLKDSLTPDRIGNLISGIFESGSGILNAVSKHGEELVSNILAGIQAGIDNGEAEALSQAIMDLINVALETVINNMDKITDVITTLAAEIAKTIIVNLPEIILKAAAGALETGFAGTQMIVDFITKLFGGDPEKNTGPMEDSAEELARKQSEAYFKELWNALKHNKEFNLSYKDYLAIEGYKYFDEYGDEIYKGAGKDFSNALSKYRATGETDGAAAAKSYKEGFSSGVQEGFSTEEEYIAAMAAMGITDYAPFIPPLDTSGAQQKGQEDGEKLAADYLNGVDMGVEDAIRAREMANRMGLGTAGGITYAELTKSGSGGSTSGTGTTSAKEASAQLVSDIQSELANALAKLKESNSLTSVGTMMLEAIVAGMQDADSLGELSKAVTGIKDAINSENMAGEFKTAGTTLGQAFADGITSGINNGSSSIHNAVYSVMQKAVADGKAAIDSHSPSKLTRDMIGKPFAEGIGVGITAQMDKVRAAAKNESVLAALDAAKATADAFRQDPFGGTRDLSRAAGVSSSTSNDYSSSYTFNSPKALNYREMRQELRRVDQYNRAMAR